MDNATLVTIAPVILSVLSFVGYAIAQLSSARSKPIRDAKVTVSHAAESFAARSANAVSPDDITKVANALTALIKALSNAGPALTALLASVAFLAVGALSSGAFKSDQKDEGSRVQTNNADSVPPSPKQ